MLRKLLNKIFGHINKKRNDRDYELMDSVLVEYGLYQDLRDKKDYLSLDYDSNDIMKQTHKFPNMAPMAMFIVKQAIARIDKLVQHEKRYSSIKGKHKKTIKRILCVLDEVGELEFDELIILIHTNTESGLLYTMLVNIYESRNWMNKGATRSIEAPLKSLYDKLLIAEDKRVAKMENSYKYELEPKYVRYGTEEFFNLREVEEAKDIMKHGIMNIENGYVLEDLSESRLVHLLYHLDSVDRLLIPVEKEKEEQFKWIIDRVKLRYDYWVYSSETIHLIVVKRSPEKQEQVDLSINRLIKEFKKS